MSSRDRGIAAVALAASLLLHGLVLVNTGSKAGNSVRPSPQRTLTRVSFRSVSAPQPQPEMPDKPPEPEVSEVPEPPPEPEPPKPEKRAEKAHQPEPLREPLRQPPPPTVATTAEAQKGPAVAEVVKGTVDDPALVKQAKQEYLRRLLGHIESNKYYPAAARRRGLEAMVKISFELLADGRIRKLHITGGHKLLRRAAEEAVERSLPMPRPSVEVTTPLVVNFSMAYQLM